MCKLKYASETEQSRIKALVLAAIEGDLFAEEALMLASVRWEDRKNREALRNQDLKALERKL